MRFKHEFEVLIIKNEKYDDPNLPFHDDYYGNGIDVKDFFGKKVFGDFRIFNGAQLRDMDDALVGISKLLSAIGEKQAIGGD